LLSSSVITIGNVVEVLEAEPFKSVPTEYPQVVEGQQLAISMPVILTELHAAVALKVGAKFI
jgi:hypothetical protein